MRPLDLTVLGKHAHTMVIAWVLGRLQEDKGDRVDWDYLVHASLLELLRKSVITDWKSQVLQEIQRNERLREGLNEHALSVLTPELEGLHRDWATEFTTYFGTSPQRGPKQERAFEILRAASVLATAWEFRLLEHANPTVADISETRHNIENDIRRHQYLPGFLDIHHRTNDLAAFVDLAGRLRFQLRWSQTPMLPSRPVLDHELLVAYTAYLAVDELGAVGEDRLRQLYGVGGTGYRVFFGALFHDLPEVLTRDIISPVKRSIAGLDEELKGIEAEWFEEVFSPMLPAHWYQELQFMCMDEFADKSWLIGVHVQGLPGEVMTERRTMHPGRLLKSCDWLCAFMEAHLSVLYGVESNSIWLALRDIYAESPTLIDSGADFSHHYDVCAGRLVERGQRSAWKKAQDFAALATDRGVKPTLIDWDVNAE